MLRLALFCDSRHHISVTLAEQVLLAARGRDDIGVVAVVDAAYRPPRGEIARMIHGVGRGVLKWLFDGRHGLPLGRGDFLSLEHVCRRHRVVRLQPPRRDINEPAFIEDLTGLHGVDAMLAMGCAQKFGPALLAAVPRAVNYHNSLLPAYAGMRATRWSMYHREPVTGFTFHTMTDVLDAGRILVQGQVPTRLDLQAEVLEAIKTREAVRRLPEVLRKIAAGDDGEPQQGTRTYFGAREAEAIQRVERPEALDRAELVHRLHCFDLLWMRIDGTLRAVTQLREARRPAPRTFLTRDGVRLAATRFNYLPYALDRLRKAR